MMRATALGDPELTLHDVAEVEPESAGDRLGHAALHHAGIGKGPEARGRRMFGTSVPKSAHRPGAELECHLILATVGELRAKRG